MNLNNNNNNNLNKLTMQNFKLKLQSNLDVQIDLISNTKYLNRQESIECLQRQLEYLYQEELSIQESFRLEDLKNN